VVARGRSIEADVAYQTVRLECIAGGLRYVIEDDPGETQGYDGVYGHGQIRAVGSGTLMFDALDACEPSPAEKPKNYELSWLYWIAEAERWIVFHKCEHRRSRLHGHAQEILGPFRVSGNPPPPEDGERRWWNTECPDGHPFVERITFDYRW
jgi:hypothetical protein